ncbi:MAG: 30S ribosomal protein S2 [Patescibacteria group bacterium]
MAVPTLVELAESGAHFGHHRSLTFPKAKDFVYVVKSNVALINLEKTQQALEKVQQVIQEHLAANKPILFVGTKRSIRNITKTTAEAVNSPYITERWFGGMLTNFSTMRENIKRMNELGEFLADEKALKLSKKERLVLENKLERTKRFLGGVASLKDIPALIVLASANEDKIAIEEANQLGVPIVSITDTDMNPDLITYPIPANDDAPKAVELILQTITSAPAKKTAPIQTEEVTEAEPKATKVKKAKPVAKKAALAKKVAVKKPTAKKIVKKAVAKAK